MPRFARAKIVLGQLWFFFCWQWRVEMENVYCFQQFARILLKCFSRFRVHATLKLCQIKTVKTVSSSRHVADVKIVSNFIELPLLIWNVSSVFPTSKNEQKRYDVLISVVPSSVCSDFRTNTNSVLFVFFSCFHQACTEKSCFLFAFGKTVWFSKKKSLNQRQDDHEKFKMFTKFPKQISLCYTSKNYTNKNCLFSKNNPW